MWSSHHKSELFTHNLSGLVIHMKRYFIDNYSNTCNLDNCSVVRMSSFVLVLCTHYNLICSHVLLLSHILIYS